MQRIDEELDHLSEDLRFNPISLARHQLEAFGLSFRDPSEVFKVLWPHNPNAYNSSIEVKNFGYMINGQKEYLVSRAFDHLNIFPKVIGTCGNVLVVERVREKDHCM